MILSSIFTYQQANLPEKIKIALEEVLPFIKNIPEPGEYPLSNNAKAFVACSTTKAEEKVPYESHDIMTDIHIVLEGEEYIKVRPITDLTLMDNPADIKAFREDLPTNGFDLHFYKEVATEHARLHLGQANFCVLFPQEAHAVGIKVDKPAQITKLVVKVPL